MAVPRLALILGFAGTLPVLAILLAYWLKPFFFDLALLDSVAVYGAVILSFIGGAHWGFAAKAGNARALATRLLYTRSVLPSLAGWMAVALGHVLACSILALLFVAVLPIDSWARRTGLAPDWWMQLRLPLSSTMALLYGALAVSLWT